MSKCIDDCVMAKIYIDLRITADEYVKRYYGFGTTVTAQARDGRSVQFPASILQPYVTHGGIEGSFCIDVDELGKFKSITKQ